MGWLTDRRRRHILENPFPNAWRTYLEGNVAAYAWLSLGEQQRLRELAQVFIAEKHWEGCGGLELTDEIRVTIAGTACLMLLGRDHDLFVRVVSILVYPSGFIERAPAFRRYTAREPVQDETPVFGLSMTRGPIILSWDEVLSGSRDPTDGRNLVFHEFAHKIDETNGVADGTPLFDDNAERIRWGRAFNDAFLADKQRARRDMTGFLGDYALKNEAEYFAVATEMFFERPREMQQALPGVYAVMRDFYRIDFAVNFAVRALEN